MWTEETKLDGYPMIDPDETYYSNPTPPGRRGPDKVSKFVF